jgi:hypothetical protein
MKLVDRQKLVEATLGDLSPTQLERLQAIGWAHRVWGNACADGLKGACARVSLRILEEHEVIEWFCGHGGHRRVRPTLFGYEVLQRSGWIDPRKHEEP